MTASIFRPSQPQEFAVLPVAIEAAIHDLDHGCGMSAQRRRDPREFLARPIARCRVKHDRDVELPGPGPRGVLVGEPDLVGGNGSLAMRSKPGYSHASPFVAVFGD